MSMHIVTKFNADLEALDGSVTQMGGIVEDLVWRAYRVLERRQPQLAEQAVKGNEAVDLLEREVQKRAILPIGRRQPMADDLRHVIAVLKVAVELERAGR